MNSKNREVVELTKEEVTLLAELLETERDRLLVGIRHTDHRAYRDELRHRLGLVEVVLERLGSSIAAASHQDPSSA